MPTALKHISGGRNEARKAVETFKSKLLPNASKAIIPESKLVDYALNKEHPVGKNEALVFEKGLRYNISNKDVLIKRVTEGLKQYPAKMREKTKYGQPFEVSMFIKGVNGKTAKVKTGWIIENGNAIPRLTSIYVDG